MSSEPLTEAIPLWKRPQDGAIITGWDYPSCEAIGLLKMDFLGLRNLTIIGDALENIKANRGIELDLESVPLDDPATYELLGRGDTLGVFQLDGGPMRDLLRRMQPTGFEDVVAVIALYRPGPMGMNAHNDYADRKNNRQAIKPIHPELAEPLEEILAETYGLIVYQEQIMRIAQKVASYSLARADILRKAMGKKKREVLDKEYEGFSEGMKANGFSAAAIKALWDTVLPFADYAFNKSHAAGYGLVSYWTAYLKANYPAEYMAGLLTSVGDDKDKAAVYLADCRKLGITVLPPDVNESGLNFASVGEDIRYGLGAVRNVGVECRCVADQFAHRQGQVRRLLRLPQQDRHRRLQQEGHRVADQGGRVRLTGSSAQGPVPRPHRRGRFGARHQEGRGDGPVRPVRRRRHRDRRGVHHQGARRGVGGQAQAGARARDAGPVRVGASAERRRAPAGRPGRHAIPAILDGDIANDTQVLVGGILASVNRRVNKNGLPWASAQLEDLTGGIEVLFFPQTYSTFGAEIADDAVVLVGAKVAIRDDRISLIANELVVPDFSNAQMDRPLAVSLPTRQCTVDKVTAFKQVLARHPGTSQVHLRLISGERITTLELDASLRVTPSSALMGDLKALLGPGCLG